MLVRIARETSRDSFVYKHCKTSLVKKNEKQFDRQLTVHILVMAESIWTITFALSETTKKALRTPFRV